MINISREKNVDFHLLFFAIFKLFGYFVLLLFNLFSIKFLYLLYLTSHSTEKLILAFSYLLELLINIIRYYFLKRVWTFFLRVSLIFSILNLFVFFFRVICIFLSNLLSICIFRYFNCIIHILNRTWIISWRNNKMLWFGNISCNVPFSNPLCCF